MAERDNPLAHLKKNRSTILERSAVSAIVGLLPVPFLDDLLISAVRTTLLRTIADSRQVDASDTALSLLAEAALRGALPGAGLLGRSRPLPGARYRRLIAVFRAAGRADDLASTFAVATLFDHYCARHHVGQGLDGARGRRLAEVIAGSMNDARAALLQRGMVRARRTASTALLAAPRAVAGLARRLPLLPAPVIEAEPLDPAQAVRARPQGGVLVRGVQGFADLLGDAARGWIEELTAAFDARWSPPAAR